MLSEKLLELNKNVTKVNYLISKLTLNMSVTKYYICEKQSLEIKRGYDYNCIIYEYRRYNRHKRQL